MKFKFELISYLYDSEKGSTNLTKTTPPNQPTREMVPRDSPKVVKYTFVTSPSQLCS